MTAVQLNSHIDALRSALDVKAQSSRPLTRALERRRWKRVPMVLSGQFIVGTSTQQYSCATIDISPGGLLLAVPPLTSERGRIILYLEALGRLEGDVVRTTGDCMALRYAVSDRRRDKLADELTWQWNRDRLNLSEERAEPRTRIGSSQSATCVTTFGRTLLCLVVDLSTVGICVECAEPPPAIGEHVTIGRSSGRVARHTPKGFAVDFRFGHRDHSDFRGSSV